MNCNCNIFAGQFLQIKHELIPRNNWDQRAGEEFNGNHASYITVHYINKLYIGRTVPTRSTTTTIRQTTTITTTLTTTQLRTTQL